MRQYRELTEPRKLAAAGKQATEETLRIVRLALLEKGDTQMNGFTAAEIVRRLGLD